MVGQYRKVLQRGQRVVGVFEEVRYEWRHISLRLVAQFVHSPWAQWKTLRHGL